MEASELRVGNYVLSPEVSQVAGICLNNTEWQIAFKEYFLWIPFKKTAGIPLNEEWLLRFGFQQDQDPDCKEWFNLDRFHIRMDEPNSGFFYSGNDHASGGNADAIVQYVHQLQNLFFALCGEELIDSIK